MKQLTIAMLTLLLAGEFAFANRTPRNRVETNRSKTEKTKEQNRERLKRGGELPTTARSRVSREASIAAKLDPAINNSRGMLTARQGLVELIKTNPAKNLDTVIETLVLRKADLQNSKRTIDIAKVETIDSALRLLDSFAKEVESSRSFLESRKEDLSDLTEFLQNYVISRATAGGQGWNSIAVRNLNDFLVKVELGLKQGKSLEKIVTEHGKFSYEEFRRRCRKA